MVFLPTRGLMWLIKTWIFKKIASFSTWLHQSCKTCYLQRDAVMNGKWSGDWHIFWSQVAYPVHGETRPSRTNHTSRALALFLLGLGCLLKDPLDLRTHKRYHHHESSTWESIQSSANWLCSPDSEQLSWLHQSSFRDEASWHHCWSLCCSCCSGPQRNRFLAQLFDCLGLDFLWQADFWDDHPRLWIRSKEQSHQSILECLDDEQSIKPHLEIASSTHWQFFLPIFEPDKCWID